jgi:ATP-binding cassette, subfamily F, member 3
VLKGVTWGVKTGDRVGLVGQNGCGKTTQLKLMAGQLEPTSGEVVRSSARTKAAFLRQEFVDELDPARTLREEFLVTFVEERGALAEYARVESDIEAADSDLEKLDALLNELERQRERCDALDAWSLDSRIDKVMPGLGFTGEDDDKLVASFSGGWKVRIGIGKVLLQDPDLLLLDEPSNHLDMQSVEWLEEFLQNCALPQCIVSHDRSFLEQVCNRIVHVEGGEAYEYPGNYSTFLKLKAERWKAWEAAYERQAKFLHEQRQYIKQNRTSAARSKQVTSREKMLARMERTGQLVRQPPRGGKPLVFRFPPAPRSGRDVILIDNVSHGYDGTLLFKDASIAIERGDRMAILGPNGCGKSSMLRLITGQEKPQAGTVECQNLHNVKLAYFAQNQADALDLSITVLETLRRAAPDDMTYEEIRALLGKFLFKGDAVDKPVEALSGGEKARLALAKMMLEPANVIVLDEPTNHIDAAAMDMLEEALQQFDGTLLVVSHDRYFVSQVATQILSVENQELALHDGDYKSFMEKNKKLKAFAEARTVEGTDGIKNAPEVVFEDTFEVVSNSKKNRKKKSFGGSGVASAGPLKGVKNAKRWSK